MAKGWTEAVCIWTEHEEGLHETTYGNAFQFFAGGPTENGFKFCPYCGGAMKEQPYVWEDDKDTARERESEKEADNVPADKL